MLRRHETLADSSRRTRCGTVAPWLLPAVASLALLIATSPPALAVPRQAKPAPQILWSSFPLNPTGERLCAKASVTPRPSAVRSPHGPEMVEGSSSRARAAEASSSSRSDLIAVALVAGVGFVGLLALVGLRGARLRFAGGAVGGHLLVPVRLLAPKLGRLAGWTRSAVWTADTPFVVLGCVLAVVAALLVVRFVG